MTSTVRHLGSANPDTAFPAPLERRSIAVNTANRQLVVGDEDAASIGAPLLLIAVRYYDPRAHYAAGDFVINGGMMYRAKGDVPPGAFTAASWDVIDPSVLLPLDGTRAMTGDLKLANSTPTDPLHAASKGYVDPIYGAIDAANAAILLRVAKAGDFMTGVLRFANGAYIMLDKNAPTGSSPYIGSSRAGVDRWGLLLGDGTAETGGNSGTNLSLLRYTDAGAVNDAVLYIDRGTGLAKIKGPPTDPLGISTKKYVDDSIAAGSASVAGKVDKAGDTMTGTLTMRKALPAIYLDRTDNNGAMVIGMKNGLMRWEMDIGENSVDSGANAGSDFALNRFADNSTYLGKVLNFSRATGLGTVFGNPATALGIATKQYVDAIIPAGSFMLFFNNAAPVGWTRNDSYVDRALRIASVGGNIGGAVGFSSIFGRYTTDGWTLSTTETPITPIGVYDGGGLYNLWGVGGGGGGSGYFGRPNTEFPNTGGAGNTVSYMQTRGANGSHYHVCDMRVAYVDVIACTKN